MSSLWPAADVTTDGSANGVPDGAVTLSDFSFYLSLWADLPPDSLQSLLGRVESR